MHDLQDNEENARQAQSSSCDKMSDKVTDKEIRQREKDIEVKGIRVMFYIKNNLEILEN